MADIQFQSTSVTESGKLERIGVHSHISGLGLNELLECTVRGSGGNFIGQTEARRAMGILLKLIQQGQLAGRGILLAGPPSTGKTALAHALSQELGSDVPFVTLSASQVYSTQRSKTEVLTQAVRRAMAVKMEEETEIIEGEVVEIQMSTVLQGKSQGKLTMCTTEMETVYDLGSKLLEQLRKEKVSAGDVVRIDKANGKLSKLGRSFSRSRDYDAISSSTKFVATPEGELQKRKTATHVVSLHEIDVINSRQQGFLALFSGDTGEISSELRKQIDSKVAEWKEEGRAKLVSGVLFIDEVHLLDLECFSYLNTALEQPLAPVLVIATNRGMVRNSDDRRCNRDNRRCGSDAFMLPYSFSTNILCAVLFQSPIRGAGVKHTSPHGIPADFLDRLLIISTHPYDVEELRMILKVRTSQEETELDEPAMELLTRVARETSLRYAMQLVALSKLRATKHKRKIVAVEDVEAVFTLFYDVKRSTQFVMDHSNDFLFHELQVDEVMDSTKVLDPAPMDE